LGIGWWKVRKVDFNF